MFLTGELDLVRSFMPAEAMNGWVTDLRRSVIVPGAGHWVQQQAPEAVNAALLGFLARFGGVGRRSVPASSAGATSAALSCRPRAQRTPSRLRPRSHGARRAFLHHAGRQAPCPPTEGDRPCRHPEGSPSSPWQGPVPWPARPRASARARRARRRGKSTTNAKKGLERRAPRAAGTPDTADPAARCTPSRSC